MILLWLLYSLFCFAEDSQEGAIYSPIGKRDPFKPPALESAIRSPSSTQALENFGIEQLQLRGIMKDGSTPKALFEDPEGKSYIILEGQVIGREKATVSRILKTEVILTEKTFNYLGVENLYEKIISLPQK
jgi:Tfp pilus assembly protein PilP